MELPPSPPVTTYAIFRRARTKWVATVVKVEARLEEDTYLDLVDTVRTLSLGEWGGGMASKEDRAAAMAEGRIRGEDSFYLRVFQWDVLLGRRLR